MDTGCPSSFQGSWYNQCLPLGAASLWPGWAPLLCCGPTHHGHLAWAGLAEEAGPGGPPCSIRAHSPLSGPPVRGSGSRLCPAAAAPRLTTLHGAIRSLVPPRSHQALPHVSSPSTVPPSLGTDLQGWGSAHSCQQSPAGWNALQEGVQEHQAPQAASCPLSQGPHAHSKWTVGLGVQGQLEQDTCLFPRKGSTGSGEFPPLQSLVFTPRASGHHFQKSTFQKSSQQG